MRRKLNIDKMRRSPIIHGSRTKHFSVAELESHPYPQTLPMRWMNKVNDVVPHVKFETWNDASNLGYTVKWRKK